MATVCDGSLSVCALGTGGSSGRTFACIESALRELRPGLDFSFVDTQPFNLRTGGTTAYTGAGRVVLTKPGDCGLTTVTGSWTANLALSGGAIAYARLVRYARKILESLKADVLLLCHDRIYIETAFVRAAAVLGIPTVFIQEGPFCAIGHATANSLKLKVKQALAPIVNATGLIPGIPDYGFAGHSVVLAASEAYRAKWVAAGLPAAMIRVAGIPRYDALAEMRSAPRTAAVARLLYLVQPFAAHGKVDAAAAGALLESLAEGLNILDGKTKFEFVVRPHPRSSGDDIRALRSRLKLPIVTDESGQPLEQVVQGFDVVIGHYSSGLLESLILAKPIVCIPVPLAAFAEREEAMKQDWLTRIGAPVATTPDAIADAIFRMLKPGAVVAEQSVLEGEVGTIDGRAAQRCAVAIVELAEQARHRAVHQSGNSV